MGGRCMLMASLVVLSNAVKVLLVGNELVCEIR